MFFTAETLDAVDQHRELPSEACVAMRDFQATKGNLSSAECWVRARLNLMPAPCLNCSHHT